MFYYLVGISSTTWQSRPFLPVAAPGRAIAITVGVTGDMARGLDMDGALEWPSSYSLRPPRQGLKLRLSVFYLSCHRQEQWEGERPSSGRHSPPWRPLLWLEPVLVADGAFSFRTSFLPRARGAGRWLAEGSWISILAMGPVIGGNVDAWGRQWREGYSREDGRKCT